MQHALLTILFFSSLLFISEASYAITTPASIPTDLLPSKQLLLVIVKNWNSQQGVMQRYERPSTHEAWVVIGRPIPVVVGKNGVAWGAGFTHLDLPGPVKREGDLRAPAGIFPIGTAFGFDEPARQAFKLPYLQLTDTTFCVDDQKSKFYNTLVDAAQMSTPDWRSGEQMRRIDQYRLGAVINYNVKPIIKGSGSCIFLHIAPNFVNGTAGCTAMAEKDIKQALTWLDASKKPVFALFTQDSYRQLAKSWGLPGEAKA